jgi:glycosyltransferase involved in cell wall biosynthesis
VAAIYLACKNLSVHVGNIKISDRAAEAAFSNRGSRNVNCDSTAFLFHMRIGIDAHIVGQQKGGVETFLSNVIPRLAAIDRENEYYIYVSRECDWRQSAFPSNFRLFRFPTSSLWLQRLVILPIWCKRDDLDVVYVQRAAPLWGCPSSVVHIHDALYVTHAKLFSPWRRAILNPIFRISAHRAAKVITPSSSSRSDILRSYRIPKDKVEIVPNGVDLCCFRPASVDPAKAGTWQTGHSTPYILFLGAIERTKNIHGLLKAYKRFRKNYPEYQLVVAGKWRAETAKGYNSELKALIRELGIERCVRFTGYLPPDAYRMVLTGSRMLVFPSFGEGFGLPPLEAMASGIPVIVSNLPVFQELYGDSALAVDPTNPENIADAMARLIEEKGLADELISKGFQTAKKYSWEITCSKLREVLLSAGRPLG